VFLRGGLLKRYLTTTEACQSLDIPGIWSAKTVKQIWNWNDDLPLPLRLQVAVLLRSSEWFGDGNGPVGIKTDSTGATMNEFSRLLVQTKSGLQIGDGGLFRLTYFQWVWEPASENEVLVATKSDSAGIDLSLWAVGGGGVEELSVMEQKRGVLRRLLHRMWYDKLCRSARKFIQIQGKLKDLDALRLDSDAISDCLTRARRSTWFVWDDRSRLFFWRWPECWREEARDGARFYHTSWPPRKPTARKIQAVTEVQQDMLDAKIEKLIARRYIRPVRPGEVIHVSIPYLGVEKGDDNVRVVWRNTETGVNGSLFALKCSCRMGKPCTDGCRSQVGWVT
jgi:hypothetical protein